MKLFFIPIFIFFISVTNILSQSFHNDYNLENNLNRYWYYRERLNDYIWRTPNADQTPNNWSAQRENGLFIHPGSYMPAKRNYINPDNPLDKIVQWTDGPEALGYYILMLATEYRLLKDYGQPYASTINELVNALYALERLDMHAEHAYREDGGCGLYSTPMPSDVNGFFLRDDVVPQIVKYSNTVWNDYEVYSNFDDLTNDDAASQDHIWYNLIGLAAIIYLVDETNTYPTLNGSAWNLRTWAGKIGERLIASMHQYFLIDGYVEDCVCHGTHMGKTWLIRNPYNCSMPDNSQIGDVLNYSKYFSIAGVYFRGTTMPWGDVHYGLFVNINDKACNACGKFTLSTIADWYPFDNFQQLTFERLVDKINWYMRSCTREDYVDLEYGYEHLPLLYWIFHTQGKALEDYTAPQATQGFFARLVELLNTAPDCGPFNYGDLDQIDEHSSYDWASITRLSKPHRTVDCGIGCGIRGETDHGQYNGIDYMVLHNLYWLLVIDRIEHLKLEIKDYPYSGGDGSLQDPEVVSSNHKILAYNEIGHECDVTYQAPSVMLLPGFKVETASKFKAISTGSVTDNVWFKERSYTPNCTGWPFPPTKSKTITPEEFCDYREPNIFDYMEDVSTGDDGLAGSAEEITIFPNPTTGQLTIKNLPVYKGTIHISLTNSVGEVLYSGTANAASTSLDLNHIKNGYYLLQMNSGDNAVHEVRNVVVQR